MNAYALTLNFNNRNSFGNKNSISEIGSIHKRLKKLYFEVCKFEFGNRFARKRKIQTHMFVFIDVSGTKYGLKGINYLGDNPHIHAVLVPHKSQERTWSDEKFLAGVRERFGSDPMVESIVLEKIDDMKGLCKFVGYAAKFYIPNASDQKYSDQLFSIFPTTPESKDLSRTKKVNRLNIKSHSDLLNNC